MNEFLISFQLPLLNTGD